MDFALHSWRGRDVIEASGPVVAGDAAQLVSLLAALDTTPYGARIILLNSPGGSVGEALLISKAIEGFNVHMVVPDGAHCASACASILFIAGSFRTVEPAGLLGQHSCAVNGVPDPDCNDILALHAVSHGVSYGSVAAFVTFVPPNEIAWFSRGDVDCHGISRYPFSDESEFGRSEPCYFRAQGSAPPVQSAWRVDFQDDGFRAFARPAGDDERELEIGLFCDETNPGSLFVSIDIMGSSDVIRSAILSARIVATPLVTRPAKFKVVQENDLFSRVVVRASPDDTRKLLLNSENLGILVSMNPPYSPIYSVSATAASRRALIFAANNCVGKKGSGAFR